MITLLTRVIELLVGVLSVMSFRHTMSNRNSITARELLEKLEERNKEIERLKLEIRIWKNHHKRLTNEQ